MSYLFNPVAGPVGRLKWWLSQFFIMLVLVVALIMFAVSNMDTQVETLEQNPPELGSFWLVFLFTAYVNFCACVNRLKDTGRSGWWYLAHFIPFLGPFIIIYMCGIVKGNAQTSYDMFSDNGSGQDIDDILSRYKSGQASSNGYQSPVAPQPIPSSQARPQPTMQSPQGFGKRRGFQGSWS